MGVAVYKINLKAFLFFPYSCKNRGNVTEGVIHFGEIDHSGSVWLIAILGVGC